MQNKNSQKINFDYKYLGNKDIKISQEIPKLKNDIKTINSLFGIMKNRRTTSTKKINILETTLDSSHQNLSVVFVME